jgi:aminoglycoside phosphotransferase family enzyme/predicted kinase
MTIPTAHPPDGAPAALQSAAALIEALRDPRAYPHPVTEVRVLETHISWVLLAGDFAYKVKKPVALPFVDFSTLGARRLYCAEEMRLNRRTAPGLYLGVVPIGGDPPRIGADPPVEYAVCMRRFPQENLLSSLAARGALNAAHVDRLAARVAALHASAEVAPAEAHAQSVHRATQPALDNFTQVAALDAREPIARRLALLRRWTELQRDALAGAFAARRESGHVRECHGDLHLGNVVLVDNEPTLFDALEFDARLRWGDVMGDVGFMAMDLADRGLDALAARFVNAYLERTGDYEGLRVLRFYMVYRAMVRAKVERIRAGQLAAPEARAASLAAFDRYLSLARRIAGAASPILIAMHGPSGSGKTVYSQRLVESLGAVRIRSDVERKRMHGLAAGDASGSSPGEGIYTQGEGRRTYARLAELAQLALESGFPVIVDATCLERSQRDLFHGVARRAHAPFRIVSCVAPLATLRSRVARRSAARADASEANLAILDLQLATMQKLGADEMRHATVIETQHDATPLEAMP